MTTTEKYRPKAPQVQARTRTISKWITISENTSYEIIAKVCKPRYREALRRRLNLYEGDSQKAFGKGNNLEYHPLFVDDNFSEKVPLQVKIHVTENYYTRRVLINSHLDPTKVVNDGIRRVLEERLKKYKGNKKRAFSHLDKFPVWLNKEKGIVVKSVTIYCKVPNTEDYKRNKKISEIEYSL